MTPRRLLSFVGLAVALALVTTSCRLPDLKQAEQRVAPLPQTSFVYDSRGNLITTFHSAQDRTVVPLKRMSKVLQKAVIAIEDERFYRHTGVDLKALVRALYQNAAAGKIVSGGSTITAQLVKLSITGGAVTLDRKIKEGVLAYQLEKKYSKKKILEKYLNTVYFGQGAYGAEAAAQTYFSRPAKNVDLHKAALLAGLIASPSTFDPVLEPKAAKARRNHVLSKMLSLGMISEKKYKHARGTPLGLKLKDDGGRYRAPYFVEYVKRWFLSNPRFGATYGERYRRLFEGGLRIHTAVDLRLQRYANEAVKKVLPYKSDPHAAMTVLDPRTGAIKAMVGGRGFFSDGRFAKLNLATGGSTGRQAGSAFKPFTLITALENGFSPSKAYPAPGKIDIRLPPPSDPPVWPVQNYDGSGRGNMSIEAGTIGSVNTVYAQIVRDLGHGNPFAGAAKVVETARRMGIRSRLRAVPSVTLGTNEVNTLEMASAFGTLATGGKHVPPVAVTEITDAKGRVVYEADPEPRRVIEPAIAWTATDILQKAVLYGTGTAASIGRPQAGKTGTAQEWRDAWFVGYIPQLVAAVWVGFPQGEISMEYPRVRLSRVVGGSWPAEIWRGFMEPATRKMRVLDFKEPEISQVTVAVDPLRECVPTDFTPPGAIEHVEYIEGTQPTKACRDSARSVTLPSVIGLRQWEAEAILRDYGFSVDVDQADAIGESGSVLSQTPGPGKPLPEDSTVTVVVAS